MTIIVGIDVAKRNHEASFVDSSGAMLGKSYSFPNSHSGMNQLLVQLEKRNPKGLPVVFGMEATGHY